ncbi:hypothetical protein [Bradyrhizobium sp. 2S1]|uniref:hypothetical protein n=1 Tax=Bradyrhizobium sp. 2S1 TaxID=1404429 RepID=UPI0014080079|nr:hypothetical protein [Bradyrhizobium sp. 2S1]MCK7670319.1 hypothetical protein [Bradyrhizobium sp. 2S1]
MIEKRFGCEPDTLYKSIGRFVFNFSRFEDVVRGRVVDMMSLNQHGRLVLTAAAD